MTSTYAPNSGIELIGTGDQSGSWGDTTNLNLQIIDRITNGVGAISLSGTTYTLTTSNAALSEGQYKVLVFGGSPSGTNTVTVSPNTGQHFYIVKNSSGQSVIMTQGSGGNVTIANGASKVVYCDGAGSTAAVVDVTSTLSMSNVTITGGAISGASVSTASASITGGTITGITDLAVADGGTGASDAATARTNLGAAASASPAFTGQASFADGSASAPSIAHTGDLNAGIFFPAADTVAVTTSGTEAIRITSTGNVGIGTSSPATKLQVDGGSLAVGDYSTITAVSLRTASGTKASPTQISAATVLYSLQGAGLDNASGYQIVSEIRSASDGAITSTSSPGYMTFRTTPSGSVTTTERMRITSDGNVGIGSTAPTNKLEVYDNATYVNQIIRNQSTTSLTSAALAIGANNGTQQAQLITSYITGSSSFNITSFSSIPTIYTDFDTQVFRNAAGTVRASIDSSGNFKFNSGYGSAATAYGCRAWVNFAGATGTIRGSANVTSVSRTSAGTYTINFTTAMPDANYGITGVSSGSSSGSTSVSWEGASGDFVRNTSSVQVQSVDASGNASVDAVTVCIAIFR